MTVKKAKKKVKRTPIKTPGAKERLAVNEEDHWEDCWICRDVLRQRSQTRLYCTNCNRGVCHWHGQWRGNNPYAPKQMYCIICGASKEDKER